MGGISKRSKLKVLDVTDSICPICLKRIKAYVVVKNNRVFLFKYCKKHGKFMYPHFWDDVQVYKFMTSNSNSSFPIPPHGLIVDVTSKCNLSCAFCFRKNYKEKDSNFLISKIKEWRKRLPFSIVFLFGGEPTLRKDLHNIIKKIRKLGIEVSLFTNGLKLTELEYVRKLKEAGLTHITLSFDSMYDKVYRKMRGRPLLKEKIIALNILKGLRIPTSLFVVLTNLSFPDDVYCIVNLKTKFPNIGNIYLSSVTQEGKTISNCVKSLNSSQIIKHLCSSFNLDKSYLFLSTKFDHFLTNLLWLLKKKNIKHTSPFCDLVCYFYFFKSNLIPLDRIFEFRKFCEMNEVFLRSRSNIYIIHKTIATWISTFLHSNYKGIFLKESLYALLMYFFHFVNLSVHLPHNFLRVIITRFQDRYNLDLRSFHTCNLFSLSQEGKAKSFCERLILENR